MSYFTVVILIHYSDFYCITGLKFCLILHIPCTEVLLSALAFWFLNNGVTIHMSVTKV